MEAMPMTQREWPCAYRYALLAVGSILTLSICHRLWLEYVLTGGSWRIFWGGLLGCEWLALGAFCLMPRPQAAAPGRHRQPPTSGSSA
jgi:hypothetical protein